MSEQKVRRLLISVGHEREIALAKATLRAIAANVSPILLFRTEDLRRRFGESAFPSTIDARTCALQAQHFAALVSFAPSTVECSAEDLLLFGAFDALGVPTVQVQYTLLQRGVTPTSPEELSPHFSARRVITWSGPTGVGYLHSPDEFVQEPKRLDQVAVLSAFDCELASEEDKFRFVIAIAKLATAHHETTFVWAVRPEEREHPVGRRCLEMLDGYGDVIRNLALEEIEPAERAVRRCGAAVAMLSTGVLDLDRWAIPTLLYTSDYVPAEVVKLPARTFRSYRDAEALWPELRRSPLDFRLSLGVEPFDVAGLRTVLAQAMELPRLPAARNALEQLAWHELMQTKAALAELAGNTKRLEAKITKLEETNAGMGRELPRVNGRVGKLAARVEHVADRIGQLQRSTLAYKAKKLITSGRVKPA